MVDGVKGSDSGVAPAMFSQASEGPGRGVERSILGKGQHHCIRWMEEGTHRTEGECCGVGPVDPRPAQPSWPPLPPTDLRPRGEVGGKVLGLACRGGIFAEGH